MDESLALAYELSEDVNTEETQEVRKPLPNVDPQPPKKNTQPSKPPPKGKENSNKNTKSIVQHIFEPFKKNKSEFNNDVEFSSDLEDLFCIYFFLHDLYHSS